MRRQDYLKRTNLPICPDNVVSYIIARISRSAPEQLENIELSANDVNRCQHPTQYTLEMVQLQ